MKQLNIAYLTPTYEAILSACIKLKDISRVYVLGRAEFPTIVVTLVVRRADVLQAMLDGKLLPPNSTLLLQLLKIATTEDNIQVASVILTHLQRSETAVLTQ